MPLRGCCSWARTCLGRAGRTLEGFRGVSVDLRLSVFSARTLRLTAFGAGAVMPCAVNHLCNHAIFELGSESGQAGHRRPTQDSILPDDHFLSVPLID